MRKAVRINRIKPMTLALFLGVMGLVFGLALAVVVLIRSAAVATTATDSFLQGLMFGLGSSALVLLVAPAIYFAVGWLAGYIDALIVNLVLSWSGGVEFYVSEPESLVRPRERATSAQPAMGFGEQIPRSDKSRRRF
jgi:vacuolar-type H+-ATPase subunit I/STV1